MYNLVYWNLGARSFSVNWDIHTTINLPYDKEFKAKHLKLQGLNFNLHV